MLGLSITAIGLRPIQDCLQIFGQLQQPLQLEFLELAIGAPCTVDQVYPDVPLILHDSCLYEGNWRYRLNLLQRQTWRPYVEFAANHPVLALSLHAPRRGDCSQAQLEAALKDLEQTVQVPVYVEVMPTPDYWCSSPETLVCHPLLLDVSHVLIWHRGDQPLTQATCLDLLKQQRVGAIHLSHNRGQADSHDLIPPEVWFNAYLPGWSEQYLVTYESLPMAQAAYQRLDKRRPAIVRQT